MSTLNIKLWRDRYPDKSDAEIAEAIAKMGDGVIAVVRYKNPPSASDFTRLGTCETDDEIQEYLNNPRFHDVEIVYDGRAGALRITEALIISGHCAVCDKPTTVESLTLMGGNDFYVCPLCGHLFCDGCYIGEQMGTLVKN